MNLIRNSLIVFAFLIAQEDFKDLDSLFSVRVTPLNTSVSTATKYDQSSKVAPNSVTVVTADEIERYGFKTMDETLNYVRSFYLTNDRSYHYIGSRGLSILGDYNNRLLFLLNGHRLNENIFGSALIGTEAPIDMSLVERIEVVRGPGSALYGSNALISVVNIITKGKRYFKGNQIEILHESLGQSRLSMLHSNTINEMDYTLSFSGLTSPGQRLFFPELDKTEKVDPKLDKESAFAGFFQAHYKTVSLNSFFSWREKYYPTASFGTAFNIPGGSYLDQRFFAELLHKADLPKSLKHQFKIQVDHYYFEGSYVETETDVSWDSAEGLWFTAEEELVWSIGKQTLTLGSCLKYDDKNNYAVWDAEEETFFHNVSSWSSTLYAQTEYSLRSNLNIVGGFRYDYKVENQHFTPRFAIVYLPVDALSLKYIYSNAYRNPNIYEQFYEEDGFSLGNPHLKKEHIVTTEAIAEYQSESYKIIGLFFHYHLNNFIYGTEVVQNNETLFQYQNRPEIQVDGAEFEFRKTWENKNSFFFIYTFQKGIGPNLTNAPEHIVKSGLSIKFHHSLTTSLSYFYEEARQTLYEENTKASHLTNLNIVQTFFNKGLSLGIQIKNIFDSSYYNPASFDLVPIKTIKQDGRNYVFSFKFHF